ncbi:MAG: hypothetical protein D6702_10990 [Planctomycetota bacterium]|nr:MAG: hypothetical protein D6702_10990 [Planctomycetota bacterium]
MTATALLLAAGLATRLGSLRRRWAKACVPVAGTSPLAFLLPRLAAAGVDRVWINLHHRPEQVRAQARAAAPPGLELRFLEEKHLLGTGGTLAAVAEADGALPDLVVNAKVFTDFPFGSLLADPEPALVLHPASPLREFGGLRHARGRIVGLAGRDEDPARAAVYTGIARPDPAWLPHLTAARPAGGLRCLVRHGLLPALAAGRRPRAVLHAGWWREISTPERLARARAEMAGLAGRES